MDLAAEGLAILMISSEMPEILGMSDRIAVMRGGTIVGTLDAPAATRSGCSRSPWATRRRQPRDAGSAGTAASSAWPPPWPSCSRSSP